jgi:hypothetical protein
MLAVASHLALLPAGDERIRRQDDRRHEIEIWGAGEPTRNFMYVDAFNYTR